MCGILGIAGASARSIDDKTFVDALDLIRHRGPNGGAYWRNEDVCLGHRRLAIVDLAPRADQPMLLNDLAIVFNGEIYNHRLLRRELEALGHRFATTSDTEVLMRAWMQWGRDCLCRFEGMFAFALWDRKRKTLTLARDRFGEKPLFVHRLFDGLAFASELPPLIRLAKGALKENRPATGLFFLYSYIPAPYGPFEDVHQLEAGCWIEWDATQHCREGRYYDPFTAIRRTARLPQVSYSTAVQELRKRLSDAVTLRVKSADVPVASLLSGGIDSSVITTLAAQAAEGPLSVYSLGFPEDPEFDETEYAKAVTAALPNIQHRVIPATEGKILDFSGQVLDRLGEPFADASILPTSFLCSHIAEKVALSGDAADELFAGYGVYPAVINGSRVPAVLRRLMTTIPPVSNPHSIAWPPLRAAALFHSHLKEMPLDSYLSWRSYADIKNLEVLGIDLSAIPAVRKCINQNFDPSLRGIQTMDLGFNLPNDMLKKVDYAAMMHGLEVRLPFLDSALVEWVLGLPDSYKLQGKIRKRLLRDAFSRLLPPQVRVRRKMGFLLPIRRWFRDGRLRAEMEAQIEMQEYVDRNSARKLMDEHSDGKADHSVLLWSIFVYLRWQKRLADWKGYAASNEIRSSTRRLA